MPGPNAKYQALENKFNALLKKEISVQKQLIFDHVKRVFGIVPNLYTAMAYSENALEACFKLETSKTSLNTKETEAVNLVVSEMNHCLYSLSIHTMAAKQAGFTEEQTIGIRGGSAGFDKKLDALVKLTKQLAEKRQAENVELMDAFFEAGYTKEHLMDIIILIGGTTIRNMLHAVTKVSIEFPLAKRIDQSAQAK